MPASYPNHAPQTTQPAANLTMPVTAPTDPLKVLAEVNRRTVRIPDPNDYLGTIYAVPTIPNIVYQVYMSAGRPTTIDLPPGETYRKVVISKPHLWEPSDLGVSRNEDGETVQTLSIRPYEGGLRNESLIIKTSKTTYRFNISTYTGNTYHRGVQMLAPAKGLEFDPNTDPPGVSPMGHSPGLPPESGRDYTYSVSRLDVPWRPSAVFTSSGKTFIELPRDAGLVGRPQVVDTSTGEDRPLNWYVMEGRYIVIPDTVLTKAEVRRGGQSVSIERVRE